VPGANGQGETQSECLADLAGAVKLILEVNREDAFRDDPAAIETELALA
jgi:predicted RNase H-like HicB family nuclease